MVKGCVMERVCQGARRWNGRDADRHAHALAERGYRGPSLAFPGLTTAEETVDSPGQEDHDSFDLPSSHPRVPFCVDRSLHAASPRSMARRRAVPGNVAFLIRKNKLLSGT